MNEMGLLGIAPTSILVTVLAASFLGSLHCIGMCGGFVAFYAGGSAVGERVSSPLWPHLAYSLGRLATYTALGLLAGSLGATLDLASGWSGVHRVASLVAGTLIVGWGLILLLQALGAKWATLPAPEWVNQLLGRVVPGLARRPPVVRALILGLSSTLIPCGWLYGFAATAAGTGHPIAGALVMAVFWMGTLPVMLTAGQSIQVAARVVGPRLGVIMPALLIVMGLLTLGRSHHGHHHHGDHQGEVHPHHRHTQSGQPLAPHHEMAHGPAKDS